MNWVKIFCSDFNSDNANVLDVVKCGANPVSDKKVDFSPRNVPPKLSVFCSVQPHMQGQLSTSKDYGLVDPPGRFGKCDLAY